MGVPFFLADAFTRQPYAGNAAGVIPAADGLSTEEQQAIARELGQTDSCFVAAAAEPGLDLALRWFTPKVEVDLCGHATIAAFVCLAAEVRIPWRDGRGHLRCATRSGVIDIWLEQSPEGPPLVTMAVGVATIAAAPDEPAAVARAVGLAGKAALDPALPLAVEPGAARLIVPVARLADLLALRPDGAALIAYGERTGYRRFTLLCRETADPSCFVHLRHFAPANGIPEDPVTGTAHAVAAVYLDRRGLLPAGERVAVVGEQGHAVERRGLVTVEVRRHGGRIVDVRIGGSAVIVARGVIARPGGPGG